MKERLRRLLRAAGVDIARWPAGTSFAVELGSMLRRDGISIVFDVGARHGDYGRLLRSIRYRGKIVSFEPVAANFELLLQAAATDHSWHVEQLALGSAEERRAINLASASELDSFLSPSGQGVEQFRDQIRINGEEIVEVRTLEGLFEDYAAPTDRAFLKIDTQGWDYHVVRGALGVLPRIHGIQLELSLKPMYEGAPDYLDVLLALRELGLEPVGFHPVNWDSGGSLIEADCLLQNSAFRRSKPGEQRDWSPASW